MNKLHRQQQHFKQAVTQALALAAPKCDGAEVSITKTTGLSVSTRLGALENIEFNSDGALGITVYRNHRRGSATTTDLRPAAIAQAVKAALEMVRYTSPDPCTGLADAALMAFSTPALDLWHPWNITPETATEMAAQAEQKALAVDKRVVNSEGAVVNSHCSLHLYGNSHGMLSSYPSSRHSISCCLIAEQAGCMERDYAYTVARDPTDLQDPDWIGAEAAKRVLARLGARQIPTQQTPVLLSAEVASTLLGHLASAISGGNLYRKSSFLLDHLGQQILPDWLSIIEQPHRRKGLASTPFDAEGVRTQEQPIVADGRLQTYLLNSYQARKLGMQSTGHAGGIHNWQVVADQAADFATLLHYMQRGLVVTELMGQGVNIVTGDYSRGAAGFWVEGGEIQYPVHEVTIAADLKTMLRNIVAIGNDIETRTTIQTGSLLLESMKIAGV